MRTGSNPVVINRFHSHTEYTITQSSKVLFSVKNKILLTTEPLNGEIKEIVLLYIIV